MRHIGEHKRCQYHSTLLFLKAYWLAYIYGTQNSESLSGEKI